MGCTDKNADEMSLKFGQPDHLAPPSQRQGRTVRWLSLGLGCGCATRPAVPFDLLPSLKKVALTMMKKSPKKSGGGEIGLALILDPCPRTQSTAEWNTRAGDGGVHEL